MRKTYIRFVVPVFVFFLALAISGNIPSGHLFALQAGGGAATASPGAVQGGTNTGATPDTGSQPGQPGYSGSDTGTDQNPGVVTSPDNNSSGTGLNQAGSDNNAGSNVDAGQSPVDQGTTNGSQGVGATGGTDTSTPGAGAVGPNQVATPTTDTSSRNVAWGSIIISFIVGLVIGGLIFGRRTTNVDRTNLRRTA